MSEAKFTKGPWKWVGNNCLDGADGVTVLESGDDGRNWGLHGALLKGHPDDATDKANRDLIAVAPDLYAALQAAETWLEGWASAEPYLSIIRAALKRAQGDQS